MSAYGMTSICLANLTGGQNTGLIEQERETVPEQRKKSQSSTVVKVSMFVSSKALTTL